jgi:hypothetical protein
MAAALALAAASGCAEGGVDEGLDPGADIPDTSTTTPPVTTYDASTPSTTYDASVPSTPSDASTPSTTQDSSAPKDASTAKSDASSALDSGAKADASNPLDDLINGFFKDSGAPSPDASFNPPPDGGGGAWKLNPGSFQDCPKEPPPIPIIGGLCAGVYYGCGWTNGAGQQYSCICDWIHWLCI